MGIYLILGLSVFQMLLLAIFNRDSLRRYCSRVMNYSAEEDSDSETRSTRSGSADEKVNDDEKKDKKKKEKKKKKSKSKGHRD